MSSVLVFKRITTPPPILCHPSVLPDCYCSSATQGESQNLLNNHLLPKLHFNTQRTIISQKSPWFIKSSPTKIPHLQGPRHVVTSGLPFLFCLLFFLIQGLVWSKLTSNYASEDDLNPPDLLFPPPTTGITVMAHHVWFFTKPSYVQLALS